MKLLTLLEDALYTETTFTYLQEPYRTQYAPVASNHFLKPDEIIVFLTREAEENIYPDFRKKLPDDLPVTIKHIPAGSTNDELWMIAQSINQSVGDGDEVALDITHGPLSFPLVALMVIIFMRLVRDIHVHAILYGAYGIDKGVESGITPVFNLGNMLSWVEWFVAADRFINAGDAQDLGFLLKEYRSMIARSAKGNKDVLSQLGNLGKLAGVLENISQSLHMLRPYQAMTHISDLEDRLEQAMPLIELRNNPLPTGIILERLRDVYLPLSNPNPNDPKNARQTLVIERKLISWYAERELWVEAITLAREWIVGWTMIKFELNDLTERRTRQRIENVLAAEAYDFKDAHKANQCFKPIFLRGIPQIETVLALWLEVIEVRNDINHAGKRPHPSTPKSLISRSQKCIQELQTLTI